MPNYENGKIYKIVNDVDDDIYIGSTCSSLNNRLSNHKASSNSGKTKLYNKIRSMEKDNFKIELIENYPCNNRTELELREGFYIESLNAKLNILNPMKALFYVDILNIRKNQSIVCECGGCYIKSGKSKHIITNKHLEYVKRNN